jgi:hypothetical protein
MKWWIVCVIECLINALALFWTDSVTALRVFGVIGWIGCAAVCVVVVLLIRELQKEVSR